MDPLWLLSGEPDAPGWALLEQHAKDKLIDWRLFDRDAWALVAAPEAPTAYEGMQPTVPQDGLYIDHSGNHVYVVNRLVVPGPEALLEALGEPARELMDRLDDPLAVLQRLNRVY